jgi:hypothetical protein
MSLRSDHSLKKFRRKLFRPQIDQATKKYLAFSVAAYVLALLLPAYGGMPFSDKPLMGWECFVVGWQCLFQKDPIWVIWTANITLVMTWLSMIYWKKWNVVPAVSTVVLSATLLILDPNPAHYLAGGVLWFL